MAPRPPIYLDNHATTPVDPRVLEAMLPYFGARFGNASSRSHSFGWEAAAAVSLARERVAGALGADPDDVVFTSGATESDNLAILGVAGLLPEGGRIVTSAVEHHAVLDTCRALDRKRWDVAVVGVDERGLLDPQQVADAIDDRTVLVSVMAVNNEVGTINPIADIGRVARERGVTFHCDAAQALGRVPVDVDAWGVDLLSLSAHKFYGPKGVGALLVRRRREGRRPLRLAPIVHGGGQEGGVRPGTLNVPGIVGLGRAAELLATDLAGDVQRIARLRDTMQARFLAVGTGARINGHPTERVAGNLNVSFAGVDSESLLLALPGLALSAGAACASGTIEPSAVLRAMGLGDERAREAVRFGLGRFTTEAEADEAAAAVLAAVERLRVETRAG